MLHVHHGWTRLAQAYGSRADFDAACEAAVAKAAKRGCDSPSLLARDEFLACEYYGAKHGAITPETTHVVALSADEIQQFADEAAASKAYSAARRDYGLERLTCDRGGHAGPSERVDVSDVRVSVAAPSGLYRFDFGDPDAEVTDEMLEDKDVPQAERADVRAAIEAELASILAE